MAFSISPELAEMIKNLTGRLKIVDFVIESDTEIHFTNPYDSITLKILTSFIYSIEVMAAMIMFSFVSYERSGAAGYYRTVVNQLLAWLYGGVSYSVCFLTGL